MANLTPSVAIVGAGPYGLSLAAHLANQRVPFRIFGPPLQVWRTGMPVGMQLKSDGFASDLYDPERSFTLRHYCHERGIAYADYGLPVQLDTFVGYALEFQRRFVSMLEPVVVREVRRAQAGFLLRLEHGEQVAARAVVMATGISYYGRVPEPLASLPPQLCTHSGAHRELSDFRDRTVVVVGAGASATDLAALLHQAGARVQLVARHPLEFHLPPSDKPRTLLQRLRAPNLGLGPGLRSAVYTAAPGLFRALPHTLRARIVRRHLGPSGGWFMKDQVIGKVGLHIGYEVVGATSTGAAVTLQLRDRAGKSLQLAADHVIAATGYEVSVDRLELLELLLRRQLTLEGTAPVLSGSFESSVPGLFFIGVTSAGTFGPVMRFARGAEYSARRLGAYLGARYRQQQQGYAEAASL